MKKLESKGLLNEFMSKMILEKFLISSQHIHFLTDINDSAYFTDNKGFQGSTNAEVESFEKNLSF